MNSIAGLLFILDQQDRLRGRSSRRGETGIFAGVATPSPFGRKILKVVPRPNSLYTQIFPPLCVTIPWTVDKPSPVPFPTPLVVKKGSKMRDTVS